MMLGTVSRWKAPAPSQVSVRPEAIAVMREMGIDISGQRSKHVDEFDGQHFDYVITVCDNAKESCPVFFGAAKRLHQILKTRALYWFGRRADGHLPKSAG